MNVNAVVQYTSGGFKGGGRMRPDLKRSKLQRKLMSRSQVNVPDRVNTCKIRSKMAVYRQPITFVGTADCLRTIQRDHILTTRLIDKSCGNESDSFVQRFIIQHHRKQQFLLGHVNF